MSGPTPKLNSILLCDFVAQDPQSGKSYVMGVFDRIWIASAPATHRFLTIYARLTDAEGSYKVRIDFVNLATSEVIGSHEVEQPVEIRDRLSSFNVIVGIQNLPIPGTGDYSFQLHADDKFLGETPFHVRLVGGGGQAND